MKIGNICLFMFVLLSITTIRTFSQHPNFEAIPAEVDFSKHLQTWDGFGFNYVETAQTRNYDKNPQDYGGFSLLSEKQKQEIIDLVFGEKGLQVQIVKMFLDPYHQSKADAEFDHEKTTANMMYFVKNGLQTTQKRGDDLEIITTLYGPPAWATKQKFIGGRDLDTSQIGNLCNYFVDWVKYLKKNDLPVKYVSLHNEGEDFYRWNYHDGTQRLLGFDFNMYWPPDQVNRFLKVLPQILLKNGLDDIKVTNGEPSNWTRFYYWNYATTLYDDNEAMNGLGLITTHGFIQGNFRKLSYGTANSLTTSLLRNKKPDLHAWVTSFSWGEMGTDFLKMSHENIYTAQVNAIIPWAGIQNPSQWIEGDPNPGTAIRINDNGTYEIMPGYYFYKQLTLAGHRGMAVAKATLANPVAFILAFASNNSGHPDAFVLTSNIFVWSLPIEIKLNGTKSTKFKAFRTNEDGSELCKEIGVFEVKNGSIIYDPPKGTTTTFIAVE